MYNQLHPFWMASAEGVGGTSVPAVGGPDSVQQSQVGAVSDAQHPLDARASTILDDDGGSDDLGTALMKGSRSGSRGNEPETREPQSAEAPSFFDVGFDATTLEAPLQGVYRDMEAALSERLSQVPDAETLGLVGQKAEAFDQLIRNPEFVAWAEKRAGVEHQPSVGEQAAQEAQQNYLEGLDDDVQKGISELIQRRVDEAISTRVAPLSDAFYAKEATNTINALKEQYGPQNFERLAPTMHRLMEATEGLDVAQAFKLARFAEMETQLARSKQTTVENKFHANMEADGSVGTQPVQRKQARSVAEAVEQALDMVRNGDPGAFDPTRLPPGYRE